jgi:hypothetical protein
MSDKNLQDIKDAITDAGGALLAYSKTGSVFLPLDGDLYVAVGSLAGIAHVAGKSIDEAAPAVPAPSQGPVELTDKRIGELWLTVFRIEHATNRQIAFARAIERELRAGSSDVRDKAPQWISVDERLPEPRKQVLVVGIGLGPQKRYTTDYYAAWYADMGHWERWPHQEPPTHWMPLPEAPAASKE